MTNDELLRALNRLGKDVVDTPICASCRYKDDCDRRDCAIVREAVERVEKPEARCRVGQKVWFVLRDAPYFYPETLGWYIDGDIVRDVCQNGFAVEAIEDGAQADLYDFDLIGKEVFLSREEAEKRVQELTKGDDADGGV